MDVRKILSPNGQSKLIEMSGQRFGRLLVLRRDTSRGIKPVRWLCQCDCEANISVIGYCLRSGHTKSCGCLQAELASAANSTHGLAKRVPEYDVWRNMRRRCANPKLERYKDYGGRGIYVCERWNDFNLFLQDMGSRPSHSHTIERIDNNGPYSPENTCWATRRAQSRNTRRNRIVDIDGTKYIAADAANIVGIPPKKLQWRLKQGHSMSKALSPGDLRKRSSKAAK